MKILYRLIFSFLIILSFSGCRNRSNSDNFSPVKVIPEKEVSDSENNDGENGLKQHYLEDSVLPRINIENQDLIVYIQNVNLDFDTEEEQVIVQKDLDNKNRLNLIVVDFDSVRNKYISTWQTIQEDINPRTFIISFADVVGDHNLEILFRGIGSSNEQILDIYRKTHSPAGIRLYYENIADIKIDGQIEIVEKERSSAYLLGQKNGISFPVITYERDEESENLLDVVKKTFIWNYQSSRFIKSFEEKIPGEKIEEERLKKLFNEGIDAYQDFLQGQWINTETNDSVISFDKDTKEIALYSKDILEIYKWTDFNRSRIPNSVYISARNDMIHFIRKNVFVRIENLNKILVTVNDREFSKSSNPWNGYYEKINSTVNSEKEESKGVTERIVLEGLYTGVNEAITFNGSSFISEGKKGIKNGIYSIFDYNGTDIIEFRFLDSNRMVGERKEYSIEFKQYQLDENLINEISLQRGEIKSQFFDASGEDQIIYKQTKKID